MQTFGARLTACITEHGTTQAEVARRAGISGASVSDWANDKTQAAQVKAEPLLYAAAFLQVDPLWLLTGKGAKRAGSHSPATVHAAEPGARYSAWPFHFIDQEQILSLRPQERSMLEGAWLSAAQSLGFALSNRTPP